MAALLLTDATVYLGASDISAYVKSASLSVEVADVETTTMTSGGVVTRIGGLKDGNLSLELLDSLTVSEIDSILWSAFGTVVTFKLRQTSAAISTSNPEYRGSVLVTSMSMGGSVGEAASKSLSFPLTAVVTRHTS